MPEPIFMKLGIYIVTELEGRTGPEADLTLRHGISNAGLCGGVAPPRSGKRNSVRVRRAGYGGAPATPGVIIPIGESEKENKRERM
jgi:hypothetical protein